MKYFRDERGFTLIELMVVILIIGILVAIAVPVFTSARASAQEKTCQANLRTLDGAVQTWKADNISTNYPADLAALQTALIGTYIKAWPACPTGGATDGAYTYSGGGTSATPTIVCPNGHTY